MSRRTKKLQDIRAAKDRRAKKMAIGGAILLAAILAFELPHYLGGKGSPSAAATIASDTVAGSTTPSATAAPGATASDSAASGIPASASSTKLPNSDLSPTRTKSELYSFDTFGGKDPFVQQVSAPQSTSPGSSGSSTAGTSAPSTPAPVQTASSTSVRTSARTLAAGGVARIAVNGSTETVRVGSSFPSANPVFRLVSLTRGYANIGIANGSYTSGARTIRLSSGRSLTLVDTADGVRYTVRLIAVS